MSTFCTLTVAVHIYFTFVAFDDYFLLNGCYSYIVFELEVADMQMQSYEESRQLLLIKWAVYTSVSLGMQYQELEYDHILSVCL